MVRVTFLFQVTVPFSASSIRVLQQILAPDPVGLLGGAMAWSSRLPSLAAASAGWAWVVDFSRAH